MNNSSEVKQIQSVTWVGVFVNLSLFCLKFITGYLGKSSAVIADAIHSLSDLATDLIIIFSAKFWTAPPDDSHPYGHKRIEAIVTVTIGVLLALASVSLLRDSILSINEKSNIFTHPFTIIAPIVSIISKDILFRWTNKKGKALGSTAIIANSWHHRSDALSSIPALFAIIISFFYPQLQFVDYVAAIIISLFILKVSWNIVYPALSELADSSASSNDISKIKELTLRTKDVMGVHAIRTRKFGSNTNVDLHIQVDQNFTVKKGHTISGKVKRELINSDLKVVDVVVHIEPFEKDIHIGGPDD